MTPYLTTNQVATLLKVDRTTVSRWASTDSTMPATRIGGCVRYNQVALELWLATKTQRSRRPVRSHHQHSEAK